MKYALFTNENYIETKHKHLFGRIVYYDRKKNFGYIHTKYGTNIHFRKINVVDEFNKTQLIIGAAVRFKVGIYDGIYTAYQVSITSKFPCGRILNLPNNKWINFQNIKNFGICPGRYIINDLNLQDKMPQDYDISKLDHIYISTWKNDVYRFFNTDSPVEGDGKCNTEELLDYLTNQIVSLH